jgi:hypothetical protein
MQGITATSGHGNMMGESTLVSDTVAKRKKQLRLKYEILINS